MALISSRPLRLLLNSFSTSGTGRDVVKRPDTSFGPKFEYLGQKLIPTVF